MVLTQIAFLALLLATLTAAFSRGGRTERIGGMLILVAALVSPLVQTRNLMAVEIGIALVDLALLAGLIWLAFTATRFWPSWAAAFQALGVLTHAARHFAGPVNGNVYGDLLVLWSYPTLLALLFGAVLEAPQGTGSQNSRAPPTPPCDRQSQSGVKDIPNATLAATNDLGLLTRLLNKHGLGHSVRLADALLARTGSFAAAIATPPAKLRLWGMDDRVIEAFAFARSITRTSLRRTLENRPNLANSNAAIDYLHNELAHLREEQFHILYLNSRHRLIHDEAHSYGTVNKAPVIPREVVRRAVELGAVHLILAHNHPGGDPTPSPDDMVSTRAIAEAARTIGVSVIDHIIVSPGGHVSMRGAGLI